MRAKYCTHSEKYVLGGRCSGKVEYTVLLRSIRMSRVTGPKIYEKFLSCFSDLFCRGGLSDSFFTKDLPVCGGWTGRAALIFLKAVPFGTSEACGGPNPPTSRRFGPGRTQGPHTRSSGEEEYSLL
jgi:hypothetical protein